MSTTEGDDRIFGGFGHDALYGGGGNDLLVGLPGNDTLSGGPGDDTLVGGAGNDVIDGGTHLNHAGQRIGYVAGDYAYLADATGDVTVDLELSGAQAIGGGLGEDVLIGIENLISGPGNDVLKGDAGINVLIGGAGDDTLIGRGGGDILFGHAGNDLLDGGDGADWASYSAVDVPLVVSLTAGPQAVGDGQGLDTLVSIENLWGGTQGDQLTGGATANNLVGMGGDDTLTGLDGNDSLGGGAGNDLLNGGAGHDAAFFYGAASDFSVAIKAGRIIVTDLRAGSPEGTDTLVSIEEIVFTNGLLNIPTAFSHLPLNDVMQPKAVAALERVAEKMLSKAFSSTFDADPFG